MAVLMTGRNTGVLELVGMLLLFFLILLLCYLVTKWLAKKGVLGGRTQNIQVMESYRLSQTKQIVIVRLGKRYHAVGISKEHMEYLAELSEEELSFEEGKTGNPEAGFLEVLQNAVKKTKKKQ